jgi:hypothetical protein
LSRLYPEFRGRRDLGRGSRCRRYAPLRKEMITEDELKSQLREQNVEDLAEIKIGDA